MLPTLFAQESLKISSIQGTANSSTFINQEVWTRGNVVTSVNVASGVFTIQSLEEDDDPQSSEAILVETNGVIPPPIHSVVDVRGVVTESKQNTVIEMEEFIVTQDMGPVISPFLLDEEFPSGIPKNVDDLEAIEHQLVSLEDAWICSPSDQEGKVMVSAKNLRARREAGVRYPAPNGFLEWDGNPELIEVVFHAFGGSRELEIFGGSKLTAVGVLIQDRGVYQLWPRSYEIEKPTFKNLPDKLDTEISIACLNVLFFETADVNYNTRRKKLARYILGKLKVPDVIALQEVGGRKELEDLVIELKILDSSIDYQIWIEEGGSLNNAYLTRSTLSNVSVQQLGVFETLSLGGRKHDRPPLLLTANVNTAEQQEISILNLHQRSLNGIEGSNSEFVRVKRHEQAVSVANMIKGLQNQDRNLIVLGDFNAFEFSDGYVDVVNQIRGSKGLGAEYETLPIVEEQLQNISESFSIASEQYSYVFDGNIQILDHCLAGALNGLNISDFNYVRGNSDAPNRFLNGDNDWRVSDHDGFVLFVEVGEKPAEIPFEVDPELPGISYRNPLMANDVFKLFLVEKDNVNVGLYSLDGKQLHQELLPAFDVGEFDLDVLDGLPEGMYILKVESRDFKHLGKIILLN